MSSRNRKYTNDEIIIYWRADLCVHNTSCYRTLRAVFDPSKRPWVNAKGAPSDEIKAVIEKCPTDALTFKWCDEAKNATETSPKLYKGDENIDFKTNSEASSGVKINIRPNGPIIIEGNCEVEDDGVPLKPQKMYSFCRCGASKNMPFCDGAHFSIGFKDR